MTCSLLLACCFACWVVRVRVCALCVCVRVNECVRVHVCVLTYVRVIFLQRGGNGVLRYFRHWSNYVVKQQTSTPTLPPGAKRLLTLWVPLITHGEISVFLSQRTRGRSA